MADLPSEVTAELLEAVLAWRQQGSLSRWSTAPSMHLARLADRLVREYPELDELRYRASKTAVENAMAHAERLKTPVGRAREMAALASEMTDLVARIQGLIVLDDGLPPEDAADG